MASANFHRLREEQAEEAARRASETGFYRVLGKSAILGVKPGKVVRLSVEHAARLLASGNVEEINQRSNTADETGHESPDNTKE
ncbi:hypothetical protein [Rhodococcus phage REQ1]|uniref:hypothetical protein n=1 Tax=Rhodococcus phage REQ1 TaxID=1109712 RepID=UPI00023EEC6B|nr:hypothetical protein RoPhREQ1_gp73 [Rhodococcus phage REQ1]AEV52069.1 hypothetical protein [Rhodococcus phage REQ1]